MPCVFGMKNLDHDSLREDVSRVFGCSFDIKNAHEIHFNKNTQRFAQDLEDKL